MRSVPATFSGNLIAEMAKHIKEGGYTFTSTSELKLLVSNKLGHDLPMEEIKKIEKLVAQSQS